MAEQDLRIITIRRHVNKQTLKARERVNMQMEIELTAASLNNRTFDHRKLCRRGSPWADCIEALEIHERKQES